jgi:flagellin
MPAVLNTNAASLYAAKSLQTAQIKMADSVERLSSGLRINRASDDAAGLGITNSLTSQINGANQGIRNLNDGISMVQTAEGAIGAAQEMAQRILTLATQGANGTMGTSERNAVRAEMRQLMIAIDSIGSRTKFTTTSLLNGSAITLQASNVSTDTISISVDALAKIGSGAATGTVSGSPYAEINTLTASYVGGSTTGTALIADINRLANDVITAANMLSIGTSATSYIGVLSTQRSLLGAVQNQIEFTVSNVQELAANVTAARSNVQDTDYANETASLTKGQILQQAATAMLAQANQMPNVILSLLK